MNSVDELLQRIASVCTSLFLGFSNHLPLPAKSDSVCEALEGVRGCVDNVWILYLIRVLVGVLIGCVDRVL